MFGQAEAEIDAPIEGTNGATPKMLSFVNSTIQNFLGIIQIPIFGGIIFVLLVLGELNFWSPQVNFETEPFSSVGKFWPPLPLFLFFIFFNLVPNRRANL